MGARSVMRERDPAGEASRAARTMACERMEGWRGGGAVDEVADIVGALTTGSPDRDWSLCAYAMGVVRRVGADPSSDAGTIG